MLDALRDDGERRDVPSPDRARQPGDGLAATRWPGRLELLEGARLGVGRILLDGAHNPAGARALATALAELGVHRIPLVFGAMRGKRRRGPSCAPSLPLDPRPIFTAVDDPDAHAAEELLAGVARASAAGAPRWTAREAALERAVELRRGDEPIVVAGSLYLVGALRGVLTGEAGGELTDGAAIRASGPG